MTIVDRYLARLYLKTLAVVFFGFFGLFVVIDGFNNLEEFLSNGKRHAWGTLGVLVTYYGPRMLWLFDYTAGILAMVSASFVLTWVQRTNEMTALVAAGISPARIMRSVLVASIGVALLGAANREFGLPRVRNVLTSNAQDLGGNTPRKCTPRYDLRTDILIGGKETYAMAKRIAEPLFRLPPEFAPWGRQIAAANAVFQPATADHPAGYLLTQVHLPSNHGGLPSQTLDERPVLFSPKDAAWLKSDECFVASIVSFEQLSGTGTWRQLLSTWELIAGLRAQTIEPGADVRIALHTRFVQPLLDLSLVLVALPLVLGRGSRNILGAALLGGLLITTLLIVVLTCRALGANYVLRSTTLAAWLPLLIFGPLGYAAARPLWD